MEPDEFGCHEEDGEKDDDSLIDKCWVAQYKGDSRKWLIRDASHNKRRGPLISSMKAAYTYPPKNEKEEEHILGKRKTMLLQKFYKEASEEAIKECNAPPPVEDYCTEYDINFKIPGFRVDEEAHTKYPELYQKYPLYGTLPTTIYSYNVQNQYPRQGLGGHTTSTDRRSPFKRSSAFTTPIPDRMEDTNL